MVDEEAALLDGKLLEETRKIENAVLEKMMAARVGFGSFRAPEEEVKNLFN